MAYISSFAYCDSFRTEIAPDGKQQQLFIPLQLIRPVSLPSNYSFVIICNIVGLDTAKENYIKIQFITSSGKIIVQTENVKVQIPEATSGVQPDIMQFNLDIRNIVIDEYGDFTTKIFLNEEILGEYKIPIRQGYREGDDK